MALIKRILKASFGLIVVLFIGILLLRVVGYLTDEAPISDVQMTPLVEVADADNAYLLINFVDQPDFSFGDDTQLVESLLQSWDSIKATDLLKRRDAYLSLVEQASQKVAFKSTALSSIDLPRYTNIGFLSKLALVKAKLLAEKNDYQQAARYFVVSLKFNNLIKRDASATLISHLIGQAYQAKSLKQISEFSQSHDVPGDVLNTLQSELYKLNSISRDGFELVWSGEQIYSTLILDDILKQSFFERIEIHGFSIFADEAWWGDWYSLALLLIPEYAMQQGKFNNRSLESNKKFQAESNLLCVNRLTKTEIERPSLSWFEILKPNGIAEAIYPKSQAVLFDNYFNRRCASNFYINATELLIAVKRYENSSARRLLSLDQLVPDYIDALPVDPFSGKALRLDSTNRYLYSYGANFNDDGGSLKSVYSPECHRDQACFNNPTVSLGASRY